MKNNFSTGIYKAFSYGFISLIVILITLTFGVPDFISRNKQPSQSFAAQVANEVITRRELSSATRNYLNNIKQNNVNASLRQMIENYMLNQLINAKVFYIMLTHANFGPTKPVENKLVSTYLKEYFPAYFSSTKYNMTLFKTKVLRPNNVSLNTLRQESIVQLTQKIAHNIIDNMDMANHVEQVELARMSAISLSYQIVFFNKEAKERFLLDKMRITSQEIQDYFDQEQAKDIAKSGVKKDLKILTDQRKKNIVTKLKKEKLKGAEGAWLEEIEKDAKSKVSLGYVRNKYGLPIIQLAKIPLLASDPKRQNLGEQHKRILNDLYSAKVFRDNALRSTNPEVHIYHINGQIYWVIVSDSTQAQLPPSSEIYRKKETLHEWLDTYNLKTNNKQSSADKNSKLNTVLKDLMIQKQKNQIRIKRFNNTNS